MNGSELTKEKVIFKNFLCIILLMNTSCASLNKSVLLGGSIGAGTGALIAGNQKDGSSHKVALGVILGAGLGSLLGLGAHKAKESQDEKSKRDFIFGLDKEPSAKSDIEQFQLSNAPVEKKCNSWQVVNGNQLVQSHCIWTIKGGPSWKKK